MTLTFAADPACGGEFDLRCWVGDGGAQGLLMDADEGCEGFEALGGGDLVVGRFVKRAVGGLRTHCGAFALGGQVGWCG